MLVYKKRKGRHTQIEKRPGKRYWVGPPTERGPEIWKKIGLAHPEKETINN
uniref:Uncharacterized protein n=1 Tax=Rhizophora mucronata TaxID=61149 RepID=A0A2P2IUJ7_RHIMU